MSEEEKEFRQIVKGGGSEEDLRAVLQSRLGLSSDITIWFMTTAIAVAIVISQIEIQFNVQEMWGLILFCVYLVAVVLIYPLFIRRLTRYFPQKRIEILQEYLRAKKMMQESLSLHSSVFQ